MGVILAQESLQSQLISSGDWFPLVMVSLAFAFVIAVITLVGTLKTVRDVLLARTRTSLAKSMLERNMTPYEVEVVLRAVSLDPPRSEVEHEPPSKPPARFTAARF